MPRSGQRVLLVLSLAACAGALPAQDFELIFGRRYTAAVDYVRDRAQGWRTQCAAYGVDAGTLIPVIFPELLRFSLLRSEAENLGLATLYVARGSGAADYSVGRFQIKPSFIEALERSLANRGPPPEVFRPILEFPGARDERDRRSLRYKRLLSEEWQLLYLGCFAWLVTTRFHLDSLAADARIRFLCSAYNGGFWRSRAEIEAAETLRLYPEGNGPGHSPAYRYGDVAVDFYHRYWHAMSTGG